MDDDHNENGDTSQTESLPTPTNDNTTASDRFSNLFWFFTSKRLDAVEARVAKLEGRGQLQLVGGSDFEVEVASIKRALAQMDVHAAIHLGLEIPNLPADFWDMR